MTNESSSVKTTPSGPAKRSITATVAGTEVIVDARDATPVTNVETKVTTYSWVQNNFPPPFPYALLFDLFAFPVDSFVSLAYGIYAATTDEVDIKYGPLGVAAAMLFPLCSTFDDTGGMSHVRDETKESAGRTWSGTQESAPSGAAVRIEGAGASTKTLTDGAGRARADLAPFALGALLAGQTSVELSVECGEGQARGTAPLAALLAAADSAAARGSLPRSPVADIDAAGLFWSGVADAARGRAPDLEAAARQRLARLATPLRGLDGASARLLLAGTGAAVLADGTRVDWGPGKPSLAPAGRVELALGQGEVLAGDRVPLVIRVTNAGKGPLHQLRARTRSPVAALQGTVVLFGRIDPGATLVRRVELETPATLEGGEVAVSVEFSEANGFEPAPAEARVRVRSADRPVFDLSCRAVDDNTGTSVGNGDGVVQRGEAIELRIAVKNKGRAAAENVRLEVGLGASSGVAVFGELDRRLGALAAGESREAVLTVTVKSAFAGRALPITARVSETSAFAARLEADLTLALDERAPGRIIAIDRTVVVLRRTPLLEGASAQARTTGAIDEGSEVRATGELDAFLQIEYGEGKRAWIARADVSFEAAPAPAGADRARVSVVRERAAAPPLIAIASPAEGVRTETAEETIALKATVKAQDALTDVRVLLNGAPLPEERGETRGIGGVVLVPAGATVAAIDRRVRLAPGENRIAIEAAAASGEKARAEVVVVRAVREPTVVALVIGVDAYGDESIPRLRYAEADARAVAEFFKGPRSPVKDPANVRVLLGKEATATAIRTALEEHLVRRAARPEDMAIFYFAGHGFAEGERYYLAGCDTRLTALRATALRLDELREYWRDVKAERKVFLADACHSGGLRDLRGDNAIASGLLGAVEGKGKVTIAAARDKQASCESEQLRHGVFTAALLDGLAGKADADAGNRDGRVSARELAAWLDREVPALARKQGREQNPTTRDLWVTPRG